jgi:hypothetical protein
MTTDRDDILRQVLEIVDEFEDETMRMGGDILERTPANRRRLVLDGVTLDGAEKLDAEEFAKIFGASVSLNVHMIQAQTAMNIGNAIRKKFGLPPRQDED